MKTIKYFLASVLTVLVAAGISSCSDDDNYSVGDVSEGAFFPESNPSSVRASNRESVYELTVCRTSKNAPSSYGITTNMYPKTDGIVVPSSISFSGDETSTTLPITYDASKVDQSQIYDLLLTLEGASDYGLSQQSLALQIATPLDTIPFDGSIPEGKDSAGNVYPAVSGTCTGTGTYYYEVAGWGDDPGLPIYRTYDAENPHSYDIIIKHWGNDTPFTITVPDDRVRNSSGDVIVKVGPNTLSSSIYVTDYATYMSSVGEEGNYDYCGFDATTGQFYLALMYYENNEAAAAGYDYFVLDGYPIYTLSAEYKGLYVNPDDEIYAVGDITSGDDIVSVKAAFVQTSSEREALSYVLAGGDGVLDVENGTNVRTLFPVSSDGVHYLVAVGYDADGVAQTYVSEKAYVNFGATEDDSADWNVLGTGEYVDGWILPAFVDDPTAYVYNVTIRQNKTNPTQFQLVAPYGADEYILNQAGYNESSKKRNITFTLAGDYVEVLPQLCGYQFSEISDAEFVIFNYEGYVRRANEDEGEEVTNDEVHQILDNNGIDKSVYDDEEGIIEIPECPFCFDLDDLRQYSWQDSKGKKITASSYIVMPGASSAARRKIAAKAVAHPKVSGLISAMKAKAKTVKPVETKSKSLYKVSKGNLKLSRHISLRALRNK